MPGFDLKQVARNDQVILGAGVLAFIFSVIPVDYEVSVKGFLGAGGGSADWNGWQGLGILGILLLMAAAAIVAVRVFTGATLPTLPLGWSVIAAGAAALGTICILLEGFVLFDPYGAHGLGYSTGFAWGGYVLLILGIAQTVCAYLNYKASGEALQWDKTAMNRPAAGTNTTSAPYPPQQTYAPPTQAAPPTVTLPGDDQSTFPPPSDTTTGV